MTNFIKFKDIKFAPEDFVLEQDVTLKSGIVLKKGKKHFSWYEAMALQNEGKLPAGWRLPTADEWQQIKDNIAYEDIFNVLGLKLNGWVYSSNMPEYNKSPETHPASCRGDYGRYLSSTSYGHKNAYDFAFDDDGYFGVNGDGRFLGISLRCVLD